MIRGVDPGFVYRKELFEQLQGLGRARPYEPVAGEPPRRQVSGVELSQPAHVERDALLRLDPAGDLALANRIETGVLLYDVVVDLEYERFVERAIQEIQGTLDVYEAEHEPRLHLGLDVGASQVGVEGLVGRAVGLRVYAMASLTSSHPYTR